MLADIEISKRSLTRIAQNYNRLLIEPVDYRDRVDRICVLVDLKYKVQFLRRQIAARENRNQNF